MTPRSELYEWLLNRHASLDNSDQLRFRYLDDVGTLATLKDHTLKFTRFPAMDDPAEKFPMEVIADGPITREAKRRALATFHRSLRMICMTRDDAADPNAPRGWQVSELWSRFSADSGCCLVLDHPSVFRALHQAKPQDLIPPNHNWPIDPHSVNVDWARFGRGPIDYDTDRGDIVLEVPEGDSAITLDNIDDATENFIKGSTAVLPGDFYLIKDSSFRDEREYRVAMVALPEFFKAADHPDPSSPDPNNPDIIKGIEQALYPSALNSIAGVIFGPGFSDAEDAASKAADNWVHYGEDDEDSWGSLPEFFQTDHSHRGLKKLL